jgi:6-pyruvoyl-tetrahydropterin synthase
LDDDGIVVDIERATAALRGILGELTLRNLDEDPALKEMNTTTENLARLVADRLVGRINAGDLGAAASGLAGLAVTLHESHVAWATYERTL